MKQRKIKYMAEVIEGYGVHNGYDADRLAREIARVLDQNRNERKVRRQRRPTRPSVVQLTVSTGRPQAHITVFINDGDSTIVNLPAVLFPVDGENCAEFHQVTLPIAVRARVR